MESKLNPTDTKIGYLTDGATTYWIAGGFDEVKLITRDDNKALPVKLILMIKLLYRSLHI